MIKQFFALTVLAAAIAATAGAQDISGDWQGPLTTPMGELRLVLHVTKQADGTYKGTMDSPDQNSNGAPLDVIALEGSKVHFTLNVAKGFFDGTLKNNGTISGNWSQGMPAQKMPLVLTKTTTPLKIEHPPAPPSDIDGTWAGIYETPQEDKLHLTFHIKNTADGLTATADLPEMNVKGWPATSVTRKGSSVKIGMKQVSGSFSGKLSKNLDSMSGDWTEESGQNRAVILRKVKEAPADAQKK
jgi:uncharacterized protein